MPIGLWFRSIFGDRGKDDMETNSPPETVLVKRQRGFRIEIERQTQVLRVGRDSRLQYPSSLAPTLPDLHSASSRFVGASSLLFKAKQFDDGLYAAVEAAAQEGAGTFRGKAWLLKTITGSLASAPASIATQTVLGAAELGGMAVEAPANLRRGIREQIDEFLSDPVRSKPISFYTWSSRLQRIFQQDRMLQTPLTDDSGVAVLRGALTGEALSTYTQWVRLASRLTNPFAAPDLRSEAPGAPRCFLPPSRAPETELVKELFGTQPIPAEFNLAEELIRRIRGGELSLDPVADSGWYDLQGWSREAILNVDRLVEGSRLKLNDDYRKQLEDLFKGSIALDRETHIKQLAIPYLASALRPSLRLPERPKIQIRPQLSVEPLASLYLRRALGYRFVRDVLEEAFGQNALSSMFRKTADGPVDVPLEEELSQMVAIFRGASATGFQELGFSNEERLAIEHEAIRALPTLAAGSDDLLGAGQQVDEDMQQFQMWAERLPADSDLRRDCRMMVPLFYDVQRGQTKVWAFLGWELGDIKVWFADRPRVRVYNALGLPAGPGAKIEWESQSEQMPCPVVEEIYVSALLDRDEFRAHCDKHGTKEAILESLR